MKDKITEQSIKLFEKKGFSETSIQDIVDSLGVTKGTFYYYFSSKEELLMNIHLGFIDDLLIRQERILNDNKSSKQKLFDTIYMLISSIKSKGSSAKIFFREMRNLSENRLTQITFKRDQFRLNVERLVKEGMEKGEFHADLNAEIITFGILGVVNWSYQWFNPEGKFTDHEITEIFVNMILKGIEVS